MDLREAIAYLVDVGKDQVFTDEQGRAYSRFELKPVHPTEPMPEPLVSAGLDGIVDCMKAALDGDAIGPLFVHVVSPGLVCVCGALRPTLQRPCYMRAIAADTIQELVQPDRYFRHDFMAVALQARFTPSPERDRLIGVCSTITTSAEQVSSDDGMSQIVTARSGIQSKATVEIKNPFNLAPYRTFREVAQPTAPFIVRFKQAGDGPTVGLFEADGGGWKIEAIASIKTYLRANLPEGTQVIG